MGIQYSFTASMKNTLNKLLFAMILLPSVSFALPLEYTATYDIQKFGIVVAQSKYSLRHENNGIRITQHSERVGLTALHRSDVLDENSFISNQDGQFILT